MLKKCEKPGTVERFEYDTFTYEEDNKPLHKGAWVYLPKDLIPAVEKHYSTYASDDVSEENLIATRDHRAFAGLSLGSMTTYRAAFSIEKR